MQRIAVLYLARLAEGIEHFERFANSYRENPPGEPHDFYVICKGELTQDAHTKIADVFRGIDHKVIEISDEGYDIQAYLKAAKKIENDDLCLFNTFSVLLSPNWLNKLANQYQRPGVGIAGMTGSYESLRDSWEKLNKVIWLASTRQVRFDPRFADQFRVTLQTHVPDWLWAERSCYLRVRRIIGDAYHRRVAYNDHALEARFATFWKKLCEEREDFAQVTKIAKFPNPHLRTNGFMISRNFFLEFQSMGNSKMDCMMFESGPDGLSSRVRNKGMEIILVGANGIGYPVADWVKSGTFRLDDHRNLMASDNQVAAFEKLTGLERKDLIRMTWGDYLEPPPKGLLDLGFDYPAVRRLTSIQ